MEVYASWLIGGAVFAVLLGLIIALIYIEVKTPRHKPTEREVQVYWHCPVCGEQYLHYTEDKLSGRYDVRDNTDVQNHRLIHVLERGGR